MATPQAFIDTSELDDLKRPLGQRLWTLARKQPLGTAGAFVVVLMVIAAATAGVLTPYDPERASLQHMLTPPNAQFIMGTDEFGRDIFTRILYGARTALFIGLVSAFIGATVGLIIGVASAYFGGLFDLIVQRIVDIFLAFPLIIMALAVVATLGPGVQNVIIAIVVPFIPQCARVVRSSALSVREIPYVDAARALGYSHTRIILRHMAPNVMAPFLIMLTYFVGQAILLEAVLSYLGMGVQDPTPAWGLMLKGAAVEFIESAPWLSIFPGLGITFAVFGFNLFGDALRDLLDPKLRSR